MKKTASILAFTLMGALSTQAYGTSCEDTVFDYLGHETGPVSMKIAELHEKADLAESRDDKAAELKLRKQAQNILKQMFKMTQTVCETN